MVLGTADQIPGQIDDAIQSALSQRLPVYLEVGRDKWELDVAAPRGRLDRRSAIVENTTEVLEAATTLVFNDLMKYKSPVIYAGVEIIRFGLHDLFEEFLVVSGVRFMTTTAAKGLLSEIHPQFAGVYSGKFSSTRTMAALEDKDYFLQLVWATDLGTIGSKDGHAIFDMLKSRNNTTCDYTLSEHNNVTGHARINFSGVSLEHY